MVIANVNIQCTVVISKANCVVLGGKTQGWGAGVGAGAPGAA